MGLSARLLCFYFQFPLQPRETDAGAILEFQGARAKRPCLNFDSEFAGFQGRVDHVKSIDTRPDSIIETDVLNMHADILS